MNDPCRLELRGLSGSEPCGACNHPAREHRGHREYVEPEYWTVEYMIGNSDWISHGLGVYTTRAGAEEALKLCSIHVDSKRVARCDASSRIVSSSVAAVETFEPAKHSEPDSTTVTMSQDAYDAAIAGAKREGWSRAVLKLRDGHRFVQASDCLARTIPDAWPTPPNPLTKIASAMGCDENEAACLDAIDSLRRELECAEDASSMERQRRKDAESAPARGFPEALREQIAAWDQLRSGCRSAHDLIRDVHAWLASQPADETEALRARVRELEAERDSALADMTLAREDLAGCEYDLAKLIRAVYDGRGIEDAANDAEMNGREGWLDVALDLAAPGPARCMRSERDSARAKAIEECALEVLATPSKGVVYTPDSLSSRAFVDKADVVEAIRALADRGAK